MNTTPNVANLFDRNPLHVTHLQGPVDRLPDTNLRAIYERAGKILLIQRWKDIKSGDPHVFLLFETEQAASACCSRIGAVRITSDRQSTRPITASLLSCANPSANSILYMWLRSQSMTPSYTIKNPPPVPPCAAFPLSCLTPLTENCGLVVQMLKEHQCAPSWWRFVAQMYVSNKMWAAAQFILAQGVKPGGSATEGTTETGKGKDNQNDTSEDIIDISDDSMVENISDTEGDDFARMQQLQKSSTSAQPKVPTIGKHNAWLPRKRANVQGARAKLGVVPAKQAAKQSTEKATTSPTEPQPTRALPTPSTTEAPTKPEPSPTKPARQPTQPPALPAISPPFVPTPMDPSTPELGNPTPEVTNHTPPTVPTPLSAPPSTSPKTSIPPPTAVPPQTRSRSKASTPSPSTTTRASSSKPAASSSKLSRATPDAKAPSAPNSRAPSTRSTATPAPAVPPTSDSARPEEQPRRTATPQTAEVTKTQEPQEKPSRSTEKPTSTPVPSANPSRQGSVAAPARQQSSAPDLPAPPSAAPVELEQSSGAGEGSASPEVPVEPNPTVAPPSAEKLNNQTVSADQRGADQVKAKVERTSPGPGSFSEPIRKVSGSGQTTSITSFGTSMTAPTDVVTRPITPIHTSSSTYEDLSFFGRSSSPGPLDLVPSSVVPSLSSSSLSPNSSTSFSPRKRKAELDPRAFDARLKRRRHRASSKSDMIIVLEPEVSALEAEQARAAELQAEEDRVREILEPPSPSSTSVSELLGSKIDLPDYPETIASRLLGLKSRSQKSSSPLSKRSSISSVARAGDDDSSEGNRRASLADMDPRAWRATLDENEALKMKIKVLELTLPTAESVKNELYAERKEKAQLLEALEIERSLLIQSEALRRQSDVTREEQATRIRQLEDRLADSAAAAEKARETAQVATEQRRKAEEASHAADAERTKLGVLLDAERALVNSERAALAREREAKAVVESKLAAAEARLSAEQRRSAETSEEAEKERTKAKDFLDAEKAIVVAQEATLEREREIRAEIEAKLEASEARLEAEQARHAEALKSLETTLQQDLARVMGLVESERRLVQNERAKVVEEHDARSKVEKELVMLKEGLDTTTGKLKASDESLTKAQEDLSAAQRELNSLKDKLHDTELREHSLRSQIYNWHGQLNAARETTVAAEGRAKVAEERVRLSELELRHKTMDAANIYQQLTTEKEVLMMERATLARERLARKDLEKQLAQFGGRTVFSTKQTTEPHRQLQDAQSSNEQMQTQRTMLHIARTRIQELEQAIQRVEHELDVSRSAEATAKTMLQLGWGPHYQAGRSTIRRTHSSPVSDIVADRQSDETDEDAEQETPNPFVSLVKPPRQQSFKLKRSVLPARLLKVDMPQGEGVEIDLGGLPANPTAIIDLLHRSKCAGVFWDIIMDEYGAMGCFDAAEAVAAGKIKHQRQ